MTSTDIQIEQTIEIKGLTAPRVTPADIEAAIVSEHYIDGLALYHASFDVPKDTPLAEVALRSLQCLTLCVLVLRNGFTVTGESACVSPENFDAELGRQIARKKAVDKLWPLLGYALKERLS